jgi:hypothetical protein
VHAMDRARNTQSAIAAGGLSAVYDESRPWVVALCSVVQARLTDPRSRGRRCWRDKTSRLTIATTMTAPTIQRSMAVGIEWTDSIAQVGANSSCGLVRTAQLEDARRAAGSVARDRSG